MNKEFKVWYSGAPATQKQLDAIEEIVVEQEVGNPWEARIKIPVCIKEDGSWDGENDSIYAACKRVRIEARIGDGRFVPLIDGTIQEKLRDLNAQPGMSSITLVINDDMALLNRAQNAQTYGPGESDSNIASRIFSAAGLSITNSIDATNTPPNTKAHTNQPGTPMEMLRTLAARNPGHYIYVLPASISGPSIGCFKRLPTKPDGLPPMRMIGRDRNISSFNITENSRRAARVKTDHLNMKDKSLSSGNSSYREFVSPGGEGATTLGDNCARERRVRGVGGDHVSPSDAAKGSAEETSYTLSAEGSVLPECYPAILTPYRMVSVLLSNTRFSANYVIFRVTHTLGRSEYTQSFSVRGNTASPAPNPSASVPASAAAAAAGAIGGAGGASASFNIQVDIF